MQRRKELNIKQEDLSELTGISLRTVRDIERATANPSLGTMVQLMEALGIEITFRLRK
jgi:transcriptional regulator with XRE-family HTH domain